MLTGLAALPDISEPTKVEAAKKDKKKPDIKLSGSTTITVDTDEQVKIPKVTAKDKAGNKALHMKKIMK